MTEQQPVSAKSSFRWWHRVSLAVAAFIVAGVIEYCIDNVYINRQRFALRDIPRNLFVFPIGLAAFLPDTAKPLFNIWIAWGIYTLWAFALGVCRNVRAFWKLYAVFVVFLFFNVAGCVYGTWSALR